MTQFGMEEVEDRTKAVTDSRSQYGCLQQANSDKYVEIRTHAFLPRIDDNTVQRIRSQITRPSRIDETLTTPLRCVAYQYVLQSTVCMLNELYARMYTSMRTTPVDSDSQQQQQQQQHYVQQQHKDQPSERTVVAWQRSVELYQGPVDQLPCLLVVTATDPASQRRQRQLLSS